MTKNQIAYHTLQEDRRHNAAQEAIDRMNASSKASEAESSRIAAQGRKAQGEAAKETASKRVNENIWEPLKTISDNIAKVLGGIL